MLFIHENKLKRKQGLRGEESKPQCDNEMRKVGTIKRHFSCSHLQLYSTYIRQTAKVRYSRHGSVWWEKAHLFLQRNARNTKSCVVCTLGLSTLIRTWYTQCSVSVGSMCVACSRVHYILPSTVQYTRGRQEIPSISSMTLSKNLQRSVAKAHM